jgi:hypothetical protein
MIRSALTKLQKEAVKSVEAAATLVSSLNKEISQKEQEISAQKITIQTTQDELEVWREKYHAADKQNGILDSKISFVTGVEVIKFIVSAVGTGYGVNLLSSENTNGIYFIVGSVIVYILITIWERRS